MARFLLAMVGLGGVVSGKRIAGRERLMNSTTIENATTTTLTGNVGNYIMQGLSEAASLSTNELDNTTTLDTTTQSTLAPFKTATNNESVARHTFHAECEMHGQPICQGFAPQAWTVAAEVAKPTLPTMSRTSLVGLTIEEARSQSVISESLHAATATQPEPTEQTSVEMPGPTSVQGKPTVEQTSEAAPSPGLESQQRSLEAVSTSDLPQASPSDGLHQQDTLTPVTSVLADPVQQTEQSDDTIIVPVGSQTLTIPTSRPLSDAPALAASNEPAADLQGPSNALSVFAEAQSTYGNSFPSPATQPVQASKSMAAVVILGGSMMMVPSPQAGSVGVTIGTAVISPGGPAATIYGQEVSAGSQGLVAGSYTLPNATHQMLANTGAPGLPESKVTPTVAAVVPIGSLSILAPGPTGNDRAVVFGSVTLKPGLAADTNNDHEEIAASNGVTVVEQTLTYGVTCTTTLGQAISKGSVRRSQNVSSNNLIELGQASASNTELASGTFIYGGQTLTADGWAYAMSGQSMSAVSSALVAGSTTLHPNTTERNRSTSVHATSTRIMPLGTQHPSATLISAASSIGQEMFSWIAALAAISVIVFAM